MENQQFQTIKLTQVIGRGTFGTVYHGFYSSSQNQKTISNITSKQEVAVKRLLINPKYKNSHKGVIRMIGKFEYYEIALNQQTQILAKQHQPNKQQKIYTYIIMEYYPKTLSAFIRQNKSKGNAVSFKESINFLKQMLEVLSFLDSKGICHRDFKPSNILIKQKNQQKVFCLCDFGSAKVLVEGQKSITYICSRYYRAPQLLLNCQEYSNKIDIWSLGCVFLEILTNYPLFDGKNGLETLVKIIQLIGKPSLDDVKAMKVKDKDLCQGIIDVKQIGLENWLNRFKKNKLSQNQKNLTQLIVQKILIYNPQKRMSARQLLKFLQEKGL